MLLPRRIGSPATAYRTVIITVDTSNSQALAHPFHLGTGENRSAINCETMNTLKRAFPLLLFFWGCCYSN